MKRIKKEESIRKMDVEKLNKTQKKGKEEKKMLLWFLLFSSSLPNYLHFLQLPVPFTCAPPPWTR